MSDFATSDKWYRLRFFRGPFLLELNAKEPSLLVRQMQQLGFLGKNPSIASPAGGYTQAPVGQASPVAQPKQKQLATSEVETPLERASVSTASLLQVLPVTAHSDAERVPVATLHAMPANEQAANHVPNLLLEAFQDETAPEALPEKPLADTVVEEHGFVAVTQFEVASSEEQEPDYSLTAEAEESRVEQSSITPHTHEAEDATPPISAQETFPVPSASVTLPDAVLQKDARFDAVLNSIFADLEEDAPAKELSAPLIAAAPAEAEPPVTSTGRASEPNFADLLEQSHASTMEEALTMAGFYLSHYEQQREFSLKRLNILVSEQGYTKFTHGDLERALNAGWLALVPDTLGVMETAHYCLTELGERFTRQQLLTSNS